MTEPNRACGERMFLLPGGARGAALFYARVFSPSARVFPTRVFVYARFHHARFPHAQPNRTGTQPACAVGKVNGAEGAFNGAEGADTIGNMPDSGTKFKVKGCRPVTMALIDGLMQDDRGVRCVACSASNGDFPTPPLLLARHWAAAAHCAPTAGGPRPLDAPRSSRSGGARLLRRFVQRKRNTTHAKVVKILKKNIC
eukprot:gene24478-biopygen4414